MRDGSFGVGLHVLGQKQGLVSLWAFHLALEGGCCLL